MFCLGGNALFHIVSITFQLLILALFNTYVLDLKWSKKQLIMLHTVALFPTIPLYLYIGPLAIFYFMIVLSIFIYRKTNRSIIIFHVFMSLILLVISDNLSGLLLIGYFNQDMNITVTPLVYPIFYMFFGMICAVLYKKILQKVLKRFTISSSVTYLLTFFSIGTVIFIYMNIIKIDPSNFYENVKSNIVLFLVFLLLLVISFL